MRIRVLCLLAILSGSSSVARAQSDDVAEAARANRNKNEAKQDDDKGRSGWYEATRVTLRESAEGATSVSVYELDGDDLKITIDAKGKDRKTESGQVLLITGRAQWMLTKGVKTEKGYEIDEIDGPMLELKMAVEFLRLAAPAGPESVKSKVEVKIDEPTKPIEINTISAEGGLEAPWTLRGTIEPVATGGFSFDLTAKHDEPLHITGTWQQDTPPTAFPDNMSLDGWRIFEIGPIKRTEGSSTILDYGAQPSRVAAKTLGELRKAAGSRGAQ